MHLKSLHIKNFRGLDDFVVENLGRVNLIVGKNNCGKSTVLEAIRLYAGNAHPELLQAVAEEHDEQALLYEGDPVGIEAHNLPFASFFKNHVLPSFSENIEISIGENESKLEALKIKPVIAQYIDELIQNTEGETIRKTQTKFLENSDLFENQHLYNALRVSKGSDYFLIDFKQPDRHSIRNPQLETYFRKNPRIAIGYIPTTFFSVDALHQAWQKLLFTPLHKHINECLKNIEPNVEDISFKDRIPNSRQQQGYLLRRQIGYSSHKVAVLRMAGIPRAVSLNSLGDGVFRALQIAVTIFQGENGFFLIDEFENGLHHEVQEAIWNFIFTIAEEYNIQVFATTHSNDTVKSFLKVAQAHEQSEGVAFRMAPSVASSDKGKIIAVVYDEYSLQIHDEIGFDIR
jgi:AAA15 family ATPase/GTPase